MLLLTDREGSYLLKIVLPNGLGIERIGLGFG